MEEAISGVLSVLLISVLFISLSGQAPDIIYMILMHGRMCGTECSVQVKVLNNSLEQYNMLTAVY